MQQSVGAAAKK